eukprot:403356930
MMNANQNESNLKHETQVLHYSNIEKNHQYYSNQVIQSGKDVVQKKKVFTSTTLNAGLEALTRNDKNDTHPHGPTATTQATTGGSIPNLKQNNSSAPAKIIKKSQSHAMINQHVAPNIQNDNSKTQSSQVQNAGNSSNNRLTIKTQGLTENDNVLNQLSNIVRDEQLVFKLCFDQNRVQKHMRLKSIQEQLDNFIYKRIDNKQSLKQKAMKKNRQLLNPQFLLESFKERQEKKLKAKDMFSGNSIEETSPRNLRKFNEEFTPKGKLSKDVGFTIQTQNLTKNFNDNNFHSIQPQSATIPLPLVLPQISKWKQNLEIKKQKRLESPSELKSARIPGHLKSRRSSSSSSSENSVIRKLNLGQSKHLTDLYKKMYAEMTNKVGRKLQKRLMSYSKSRDSSSISGHLQPSLQSSVGNSYSDSDEEGYTGNQLFVTKLPKNYTKKAEEKTEASIKDLKSPTLHISASVMPTYRNNLLTHNNSKEQIHANFPHKKQVLTKSLSQRKLLTSTKNVKQQ